MPTATRARWALRLAFVLIVVLVLVPAVDLRISGLFHSAENGFMWRDRPIPEFLHELVQWGARILFGLLLAGLAGTLWRRIRSGYEKPVLGLTGKDWLFLLAALLIAPGLIVNTLLKDNWDRARPYQIEEFGGDFNYTPPLVVSNQCDHNCSFVSGDAAIGFYLHAFAYVVRRRSRAVLVAGLGCGALAGLLRIGMGAHFFSDVLFAGLFVVGITALTHAALYGQHDTTGRWRRWADWLFRDSSPTIA